MSFTFKRPSQSNESQKRVNSVTQSRDVSEKSSISSSRDNDDLNSSLPGTRSWTNGVIVTSTGLRDLDALLPTPGHPIGACIVIEEDRWMNDLALCIIRYWCAEALCQEQGLVLAIDEVDHHKSSAMKLSSPWNTSSILTSECPLNINKWSLDAKCLLQTLPREMTRFGNLKQTEQEQQEISLSGNPFQLDVLEEEFDTENQNNDEKLEIAWQYSKPVQEKRSGVRISKTLDRKGRCRNSNVFCHSYDLSGLLSDQLKVLERSTVIAIPKFHSVTCERQRGRKAFLNILETLERVCMDKPHNVIRILFRCPSDLRSFTTTLQLFMSHIRARNLPVIVMVTLQSWTTSASAIGIKRCSDFVIQAEGFVGRRVYPPPPEFRQFQGLLHIHRMSTTSLGHFTDMSVTKRPSSLLYGLKRDRRKLHIQPLHIPPEDNSGWTSSNAAVKGNNVAGRINSSCSEILSIKTQSACEVEF